MEDSDFRSEAFGDIYFMPKEGEAESRYVFWEGNQLTHRLIQPEKETFQIAELGFGTGLNYFLTRALWREIPNPPNIHYVSIEKFPIPIGMVNKMQLEIQSVPTWEEELIKVYLPYLGKPSQKEIQLLSYQTDHPSSHHRFTLSLYLGDVISALAQVGGPIDAFYLDGFAPSKNPEMWSPSVFSELKRLSLAGTTFSTFTAAGFVKRGLEKEGFFVRKQKGFGRKREMLVGTFHG